MNRPHSKTEKKNKRKKRKKELWDWPGAWLRPSRHSSCWARRCRSRSQSGRCCNRCCPPSSGWSACRAGCWCSRSTWRRCWPPWRPRQPWSLRILSTGRKREREREREREGERRKWRWRNCFIEYKAWLAPAYGRQEATKIKIDEIATYPFFKIKIIKLVSSDLSKHTHPPSLPLTHTRLTLHGGLKSVDGVNLGDKDAGTEVSQSLAATLANITITGNKADLHASKKENTSIRDHSHAVLMSNLFFCQPWKHYLQKESQYNVWFSSYRLRGKTEERWGHCAGHTQQRSKHWQITRTVQCIAALHKLCEKK